MIDPLWTKKVGERVIVLSNENHPPIVATFQYINNTGRWFKKENGELFGCMGMVFPFNQKWLDFLNSFDDYQERWDLLRSHIYFKEYLKG